MDIILFRQTLKRKLKEKKLTLTALSVKADLSEDTLRSIIYGKSNDIRLNTLIKIADALNSPLDELIGRNIIPNSEHNLTGIETLSVPVLMPLNTLTDTINFDSIDFEILDISDYSNILNHATNLGVKLLCIKKTK